MGQTGGVDIQRQSTWLRNRPPSLKHIEAGQKQRPTSLIRSYSTANHEADVPEEDATPTSANMVDTDVKSVFSGLAIPSTEMSPETATTAVADHSNLESPLSSRGRVSLLSIKRLSSVAGGIIPSDLLNLLHTLPFFTGLEKSEEFICKISKVLSLRKFYPGDVVVTQGETAKAMFFIIKGSLTVISDDGEIELAELASGTYFGEIGILFDVRRTATVVAKTPCTLLTLTADKVSQELEAYPEIRHNVRSIAQTRLLSLTKQYEMSGKKVSSDITRQIAEFGVAADIPVPLAADNSRSWLETLKVVEAYSEESSVAEADEDPEDIISPTERKDLSKPITSANILSKKLTEKRRASVAVWSDAKLMAFAKDVMSQVTTKESRFAASSLSIHSQTASTIDLSVIPANRVGLYTLDPILITRILAFLDLDSLNRSRLLSKYFLNIVRENDNNLYSSLNLSPYCKKINDQKLLSLLKFAGDGVLQLSLKNCWPITDVGLIYISQYCKGLVRLDLSSAWDITDMGLLKIAEVSQQLETLNLSNCRKVTDTGVLAILQKAPGMLSIQVSYCKNLTGRVMDHPVWKGIREVNFQRATSIRDDGFLNWNKLCNYFAITDLNLSDCSFLTDAAIQVLASKCPQLARLCLSFCCSLTEKFTLYLVDGCPFLQVLDASYCGAAITDDSVKTLAQGLPRLHSLGLRGCVMMTDQGIEHLATHALALHTLNFTQCKYVSSNICKKLGIEWNCISTPVYVQKE